MALSYLLAQVESAQVKTLFLKYYKHLVNLVDNTLDLKLTNHSFPFCEAS